MSKPPKATPHSDIDGVHQDEARNADVAAERGESAKELADAKKESTGRPPYVDGASGTDKARG